MFFLAEDRVEQISTTRNLVFMEFDDNQNTKDPTEAKVQRSVSQLLYQNLPHTPHVIALSSVHIVLRSKISIFNSSHKRSSVSSQASDRV